VPPDNGTLTHIQASVGIKEERIIDETVNRLPRSGESYTFHGRDVYAYTGARLAAGVISFEEVGPLLDVEQLITLPKPDSKLSGNQVTDTIDILDVRFGNVWTNIDRELFRDADINYGDTLEVTIHINVY